jgi:hypothetical protein
MVSSYLNFKINEYVLNITLNKEGCIVGLISNNIDDTIYYLEYIDGTFGCAENKELEYVRPQLTELT